MATTRRDFLPQDQQIPNHLQTRLGPFQNDWTKGSGIEPTNDPAYRVTQPGIYRVTGVVRWAQWRRPPDGGTVRANYRHIIIKVNGEEDSEFTLPSTGNETDMRMPFSAVIELRKNDTIEPFVFQVTGDPLKVIGGATWKTWISITKIA